MRGSNHPLVRLCAPTIILFPSSPCQSSGCTEPRAGSCPLASTHPPTGCDLWALNGTASSLFLPTEGTVLVPDCQLAHSVLESQPCHFMTIVETACKREIQCCSPDFASFPTKNSGCPWPGPVQGSGLVHDGLFWDSSLLASPINLPAVIPRYKRIQWHRGLRRCGLRRMFLTN